MKTTKVFIMALALVTGALFISSCTDSSEDEAKLYENEQSVDYTNVQRPK